MATYRRPLYDNEGNIIIPAMTGDQTGWVKTGDIADGAVTSDKLGLNKYTDKIRTSNHRCIYEHNVNIGGAYIGWVKIAKLQLNNSNQFGAQNIVLRMVRAYNTPEPETYTFNIDAAWDTAVTIKQISGRARSQSAQSIQQIRLVMDSTNHILYLELYSDPSRTTYMNVLYITMDVVGVLTNSLYGADRWVLLNEVQTEAESSLTVLGEALSISRTGYTQIQSAQSAYGNQNFIKYENGLAVAWRTVTTTIDINTAWGSLYRSSGIGNTWSYGVTFLEKPTINVTIEAAGAQSCWISAWDSDKISTTSLGTTAYVAVRPASITGAQVKIHFIAIGRWK